MYDYDYSVWREQLDRYHKIVQKTYTDPFYFICDFDRENTDGHKYISDGLGLLEFAEKCYQIFLSRYPNEEHEALYVSPVGWCAEAANSINEAVRTNESKIIFRNGCCSSPECSVNKYYLIVLEESQMKS